MKTYLSFISVYLLFWILTSFACFYANRINELQNEGYTYEASKIIANVEFYLTSADAEYYNLLND